MTLIKIFFLFISFLLISCFSLRNQVYAINLIYSNDFEEYDPGTAPSDWTVVRNYQWSNQQSPCLYNGNPANWQISDTYGSKRIGISLSAPSCVTEIIPNNVNIPNLANYEYEVDMTFHGNLNVDRNIAFRYNLSYQWYGLKFFDANTIAFQKIYNQGYNHLGSAFFSSGFVPNNTYNFRVRTENNLVSLYINDELIHQAQDLEPVLLTGTAALQASSGGVGASTTFFDNIKVTDLTHDPTPPATPTPTPFPYFSQRDDQWADVAYDHLTSTIEQVGCALTSTAMVLKSYGLDKIPWGDQLVDLTPQTLNDWLNTNAFKYWRQGSMNWSSISTLSQALNASDSAYTKLETNILNTSDLSVFDTVIDNKTPIITGINSSISPTGRHYVVTYAKQATDSGRLYEMNDPYYGSQSALPVPPLDIQRAIYYTPTNTDFSYLWFNSDSNLDFELINPDNQSVSTQLVNNSIPLSHLHLEKPLVNENNGAVQGDPFWQLGVKYPQDGNYSLLLTANSPGFYSFELYAYNQDGKLTPFEKTVFIGSQPSEFMLTYDPNASTQSISKSVSFDTLKQLILDLYSQEWLNNNGIKNSLYTQVSIIEALSDNDISQSIKALASLSQKIDVLTSAGVIHFQAKSLLLNEIKLLIELLSES